MAQQLFSFGEVVRVVEAYLSDMADLEEQDSTDTIRLQDLLGSLHAAVRIRRRAVEKRLSADIEGAAFEAQRAEKRLSEAARLAADLDIGRYDDEE